MATSLLAYVIVGVGGDVLDSTGLECDHTTWNSGANLSTGWVQLQAARVQVSARCPGLALLAPDAFGPVQLRAALESLLFLTPMDKPLLIRAAVAAIAMDGTVTARENLMLRALCATLDVPLPPLPSLPEAPQPSAA